MPVRPGHGARPSTPSTNVGQLLGRRRAGGGHLREHPLALVADPVAPARRTTRSAIIASNRARSASLEVGDHGEWKTTTGAVRRRLLDQRRAAPPAGRRGPAAAGRCRAIRDRLRPAGRDGRRARARPASVSQPIASASVTSSGFRSTPPRQATAGGSAGHAAPVPSPRPASRGPVPARHGARRGRARRRTTGRGRGTAPRSRRPRAAPAARRPPAPANAGVRVASRPTSLVWVARSGSWRGSARRRRAAPRAARRTARARVRRATGPPRTPGWAAA